MKKYYYQNLSIPFDKIRLRSKFKIDILKIICQGSDVMEESVAHHIWKTKVQVSGDLPTYSVSYIMHQT